MLNPLMQEIVDMHFGPKEPKDLPTFNDLAFAFFGPNDNDDYECPHENATMRQNSGDPCYCRDCGEEI